MFNALAYLVPGTNAYQTLYDTYNGVIWNTAYANIDTSNTHADSVVICEDIFCGVVPVDPEMRAWREATGRMMNELCRHADRVVRLFCGIPQVLK